MTMPGDYSEELVELVARVLPIDYDDDGTTVVEILPEKEGRRSRIIWGDPRRVARAILAALSSAGRLVPEGSEMEEQWGCRWPDGDWNIGARSHAETYLMKAPGMLLHRRVITTRWTPSEPAQEQDRTEEQG